MNAGAGVRWVACADDFAIDAGASRAIVELAAAGRLTATSALVDSPLWREAAAWLHPLANPIDVGLHLNLTEALVPGQAIWPLRELVLRAMTGAIDLRAVRASVQRQLDAFEDAWGGAPDFIDGHQHVHQFRGIRGELVHELLRRYACRPWIRSTRPARSARSPKSILLAWLGEGGLRASCAREGLPMNASFAGVYGFDADAPGYEARLAGWMQDASEGTLLMCHPSRESRRGDPIARARAVEYEVLRGERMAALLDQNGIHLERGSSIFATGKAPALR